jgi:hypothetical protein
MPPGYSKVNKGITAEDLKLAAATLEPKWDLAFFIEDDDTAAEIEAVQHKIQAEKQKRIDAENAVSHPRVRKLRLDAAVAHGESILHHQAVEVRLNNELQAATSAELAALGECCFSLLGRLLIAAQIY